MARSNYTQGILGTVTTNGVTSPAYSAYTAETSAGVHRRKPAGWVAPTSYSFRHLFVTCQSGSCSATNSFGIGGVSTGLVGASPPVGWFDGNVHYNKCCGEAYAESDPDGLWDRSLIRARNNLKSSKINLGIAFAERKRTAKLVGDTATRLAKSYRQLRRGEVRNAMNTLGIASSKREPRGSNVPAKWLEMQYGWKPMLSDVYGACSALSKRRKDDWSVTAKGRAKSVEVLLFQNKLGDNPHFYDGANVVTRIERGAYTRIDAQPSNEVLISLSALGLTNPLLIAWELVPYSFVVDWFLPVGDWLSSLDATLGFQIVGCSTSFFVKANWDDNVSDRRVFGPELSNTILECHYSGQKRLVSLLRVASAIPPIPSFPSLKDGRSLGHMANGLALLSQVFGRRR